MGTKSEPGGRGRVAPHRDGQREKHFQRKAGLDERPESRGRQQRWRRSVAWHRGVKGITWRGARVDLGAIKSALSYGANAVASRCAGLLFLLVRPLVLTLPLEAQPNTRDR